jgi:hypothetical protein
MAGNRKSGDEAAHAAAESAQAIRDTAQRIWLAGLGAFQNARTEGPRLFDALVAEGRTLGARAAGAADEALRTILELNENFRAMAAGSASRKRGAASRKRKARPAGTTARKSAAKARRTTAKARRSASRALSGTTKRKARGKRAARSGRKARA